MRPIKFTEMNCVFQKENSEKNELPVYMDEDQIVSCWKLSFMDRVKAVIFGRVWMSTSGNEQPSVWLDCDRTVFTGEVWQEK